MQRLKNKTVLITGASSGIGWELARQSAPFAQTLVLIARRQDRLETLADELRRAHPQLTVEVYSCDLSDLAALEALLDTLASEIGAIDVLINNAGLGDQALFEESEWVKQKRIIDVNVTAPLRLTHALVPGMVTRRQGGILNIGSGAGLALLPGLATYGASKHFIDGFSENLRLELQGTGVTLTQVLPGPVTTEFDEVAGAESQVSGLPDSLTISAAQCAQEALLGFENDQPLVFPGRLYNLLMRVLPFIPRAALRLSLHAQATRLRAAK